MITEIVRVDENSIEALNKAAELLKTGEIVGIPTETVGSSG